MTPARKVKPSVAVGKLVIYATPQRVTVGRTIVLRGESGPKRGKGVVQELDQRTGVWRSITPAAVSSDGVVAAIKPKTKGTHIYRILVGTQASNIVTCQAK